MRSQATPNQCGFPKKPRLSVLALCCFLFFEILPHSALAKTREFDPVLIYVRTPKLGGSEIPGLMEGKTLYLSIPDLFSFLSIKREPLPGKIIEGFLLDQTDKYKINLPENRILYKDSTYLLPTGALLEMDGIMYLHSSTFGEIFGLHCQFDYRNLAVDLTTDLELPIFKRLRMELMRENLGRGSLEIADTTFHPNYSLFKLGGLDWDLSLNKEVGLGPAEEVAFNKTSQSQSRGSLSFGGELGYGDFQTRISWFGRTKFNSRNVDFRWKKVLTTQNFLRQITLGRINGASFATIFQPISGFRLTNAPPIARKSFGLHTIRDFTHPFWIAELYLNYELVDFVKTDESGLYNFEIPLNYGSNQLQIKLYGPGGEEEIKEESVFIPFILLPKKELIYQINGGVVHGSKIEYLANAQVNYGLTKSFTVGTGVEYFSGIADRQFIARFTTSNKLGKNIMFSSEWLPDVKISGVLNTRTKNGIVLDLSFENLAKGQKAYPQLNYLSLRRFSGMIPFTANGKVYSSRVNFSEQVYPNSKIQSLQWSVNGNLLGAFSNFSTFATRYYKEISLTSTLQQTYRLPSSWLLNGRVQVNFQRMEFSNVMIGFEKLLKRDIRITSFYQADYKFKNPLMGLSFRFDLGVLQAASNFRIQEDQMLINQSLMGSVVNDQFSRGPKFSSRSELGRSTLIILPFLDVNDNNLKDNDESYEFDLDVKVKGASPVKNPESGVTTIKNLISYTDYLIELDENSLADIAWRLDHKKIKLWIKPGNSNRLEIPIKIVHEIEGTVLLNNAEIGGIKIQFFNQENQLIKEVVSQRDGKFYHSDLKAGVYTIQPDVNQLKDLGMVWDLKKSEIQFDQGSKGEYSSGWIIRLSKEEGELPPGGDN